MQLSSLGRQLRSQMISWYLVSEAPSSVSHTQTGGLLDSLPCLIFLAKSHYKKLRHSGFLVRHQFLVKKNDNNISHLPVVILRTCNGFFQIAPHLGSENTQKSLIAPGDQPIAPLIAITGFSFTSLIWFQWASPFFAGKKKQKPTQLDTLN